MQHLVIAALTGVLGVAARRHMFVEVLSQQVVSTAVGPVRTWQHLEHAAVLMSCHSFDGVRRGTPIVLVLAVHNELVDHFPHQATDGQVLCRELVAADWTYFGLVQRAMDASIAKVVTISTPFGISADHRTDGATKVWINFHALQEAIVIPPAHCGGEGRHRGLCPSCENRGRQRMSGLGGTGTCTSAGTAFGTGGELLPSLTKLDKRAQEEGNIAA